MRGVYHSNLSGEAEAASLMSLDRRNLLTAALQSDTPVLLEPFDSQLFPPLMTDERWLCIRIPTLTVTKILFTSLSFTASA